MEPALQRRAIHRLLRRLTAAFGMRYQHQASRVRETTWFSYQHGATSLLDFLQAQQDYRSVELSYLILVAAYLNSSTRLKFAVGREVIS